MVSERASLHSFRDVVARVLLDDADKEFREWGYTYNPDAVWATADRVVAAIATQMLGVTVEAKHHPTIIGPAEFVVAEDQSVL